MFPFSRVVAIWPFLHLSPSHKGPLQNLRQRPQFRLQWVDERELPPLFRTNTLPVCCWHSEGVFVVPMWKEKRKVCFSLLSIGGIPTRGGGGIRSQWESTVDLIHVPRSRLNLQTSSYRTRIAIFIWNETGWWNICERLFFTTDSNSLNSQQH